MQTTNNGYKLCLLWSKVLVILLIISTKSYSQQHTNNNNQKLNLVEYDNRTIHYGFILGANYSVYRPKLSEYYYSPKNDSIVSVNGVPTGGFNLGFIFNARLTEYLDFRVTPGVAFYSRAVQYKKTNGTNDVQKSETTFIEFPILLKYKSKRRGNNRMYMIGGFKPGFSVANKNRDQRPDKLRTNSIDLAIDLGFGVDNYFQMFKFSPEIRFSLGLTNMRNADNNQYSLTLDKLTTSTVTLYLNFQ